MSEVDGNPVLDAVRRFERLLERERMIMWCAPDQVTRIQALVDALPFEYMPGLIEVRPYDGLPADQIMVGKPSASTDFMVMPPLGRYYPPEVPLQDRYPELRARWDW